MNTGHIYSVFDEELKHLSRRIAEMGGMAEQMVSDSIRALVTADAGLAQQVIAQDLAMDQTEREIGDKAILMIAKRQPMACARSSARYASLPISSASAISASRTPSG
jgi:phosphate transport system protein